MSFLNVYDKSRESKFILNAKYGKLLTDCGHDIPVSPFIKNDSRLKIRYDIRTKPITCISFRDRKKNGHIRNGVFPFYLNVKLKLKKRKLIEKKFAAKGYDVLCLKDWDNGKSFILMKGRGILKCSPTFSYPDKLIDEARKVCMSVLDTDIVDRSELCYFPVVNFRSFCRIREWIVAFEAKKTWEFKPIPLDSNSVIDEQIGRLAGSRKYKDFINKFKDKDTVIRCLSLIASHPCVDRHRRIVLNTLAGAIYNANIASRVMKWLVTNGELDLQMEGTRYRNFKFSGVMEKFVKRCYKHTLKSKKGLIDDFNNATGTSLCMFRDRLEGKSCFKYSHVKEEFDNQFKWPLLREFKKDIRERRRVAKFLSMYSKDPMKIFVILYNKYGDTGVTSCSIRHVMRIIYNLRRHAELDTSAWETTKIELLLAGPGVSMAILYYGGNDLLKSHIKNYFNWLKLHSGKWDHVGEDLKRTLACFYRQPRIGEIWLENDLAKRVLEDIPKDRDSFYFRALFSPTSSYLYNQQRYMQDKFYRLNKVSHDELCDAYKKVTYHLACTKQFGFVMNPEEFSRNVSNRLGVRTDIGTRLAHVSRGHIHVTRKGKYPITKVPYSLLGTLAYSEEAHLRPGELISLSDTVVNDYVHAYVSASVTFEDVAIDPDGLPFYNLMNLVDRNNLDILQDEMQNKDNWPKLGAYYERMRLRGEYLRDKMLGVYSDNFVND